MTEILMSRNEILAKGPKEDDDNGDSLPETRPYEQEDEPSQNGQEPSSNFSREIGDPTGLPLAEALLASKRLVGGSILEIVSTPGAGPEENGDEKERQLGDDDEEVEPDPERESKNSIIQANGKKEDSSNGGGDKDDSKESVEKSRDYDIGEGTDIGTGN